jgi:hypothetical protein
MTWLWAIITGNPIARAIGAALVAAAGILTFGAIKKREGRKEAVAKRAAQDAKATIQAHEDRNEVEADISRAGNARDRLRGEWRE